MGVQYDTMWQDLMAPLCFFFCFGRHKIYEIICLFLLVLAVEPWLRGSGNLSYPQNFDNGEGKWVQNTTDRVILSNETLVEILGGK